MDNHHNKNHKSGHRPAPRKGAPPPAGKKPEQQPDAVKKPEQVSDATVVFSARKESAADQDLTRAFNALSQALSDPAPLDHPAPEVPAAPAAPAAADLSPMDEPLEDRETEHSIQESMAQITGDASQVSQPPHTPAPQPPQAEEPRPEPHSTRKRRPRKRRADNFFGASHILSTFVWLMIVVLVGVSLGNLVWVCASDVLAFGRPDQEVTVTISETDTIDQIADKLEDAGVVKYASLFKLYADITDARSDIVAGTFTLNTLYDYHALVDSLSSLPYDQSIVEVVIPEGYSCAQIFSLLEEKEVCTVEELENWAADGELADYWFLEGVERGHKYSLEGFLFPDTYEFYTGDDPQRVLEKLLDNFDYRFTDEMRDSIDSLNERLSGWMSDNGYDQDYIDEHQLSLFELVTVASLIEKESANTVESYTISSVIYNRLTNQAEYPYLNIDAAILYALGEHKEELSQADLEIDSPYNTYLYEGLTPGPICNPGLYSLNAALDPDSTNYHYYAMDPSTGAHHFSETLDEHYAFLDSLGD